jgi:hypothetical protein
MKQAFAWLLVVAGFVSAVAAIILKVSVDGHGRQPDFGAS